MNTTLLKALLLLVLVGTLFVWSFILFSKKKDPTILIQLVGAGFLIITVLTHVFEALQLFTFMQWGSPYSIGHYLDLSSAVLGIVLFSFGFLARAFTNHR